MPTAARTKAEKAKRATVKGRPTNSDIFDKPKHNEHKRPFKEAATHKSSGIKVVKPTKNEDKPGGVIWIKTICNQCPHQRMAHDKFYGACEQCQLCGSFDGIKKVISYS